ncbi:hypothetical protein FACS18942_04850 [Planctomycetales bacterium]|nr:hypothetical protein FACS18942_04850 [Planctomycetales bacterium]
MKTSKSFQERLIELFSTRNGQKKELRRRFLRVENLEQREMLSVNISAANTELYPTNDVYNPADFITYSETDIGNVNSPEVNLYAATSLPATPAQPVVSITQSGSVAKLTWNSVGGAAKYMVYRSVDNGSTWTAVAENLPPSTLTVTDNAAPLNSNLVYAVRAVNAVNQWSDYTPMTFIGIPQVTVAQQGSGVNISWQAVNNGQPATAKYMVYRSVDNGSTWTAVAENLSPSTLTVTDNTALPNTPYVYAVRVVSTTGQWSGYVPKSITVTVAIPATPVFSVVQASTTSSVAKLMWNAAAGAAKYMVYRSVDNGSTWQAVAENISPSTLTVTDTAVPLNTNLVYTVRAVNAANKWSDFTKQTFIGIPQVTVVQQGSGVNISWQAVNNGQPATAKYMVYRSVDNGSTWTAVAENLSPSTLTVTDSAALPNTSYVYAVRVVSTTGQWSGYVPKSITVTVAIPATPVFSVVQSSATSSVAKLTWNAAAGAAKYMVYRSVDNGSTWQAVAENISPSTLTVTDTAVPLNTNLVYTVRAVNAANKWSDFTKQMFVGIPQVTLVQQGNNVNVSWTEISGEPATTLYCVYRSNNGGSSWQTVSENIAAETTSITDSNVFAGTWTYAVRAMAGSTMGGYIEKSITISTPAIVNVHSVQNAAEGGQSGYIRLQRDNTSGMLSVGYRINTYGSTAYLRTDFIISTEPANTNNEIKTVTFADGQEYADIVIGAIDNEYIDGDKNVLIEILPSDESLLYTLSGTSSVNVVLIDDDYINHAPTASEPDTIVMNSSVSEYIVNLDTIFSDADSGQWNEHLTFTIVDVENLNLASPDIQGHLLHLTFDAGITGTARYFVRATDARGLFVDSEITVSVISNIPQGTVDFYTVPHHSVLIVTAEKGMLANDRADNGTLLTAELVNGTQHGVLQLNEDGSFTYTADSGFTGQDIFTYRAVSGQEHSEEIEVVIDVTNSIVQPLAKCYSGDTNTGISVSVSNGLLAGLYDSENDLLQAVMVGFADSNKGTLTINPNGSFTFIPNTGFTGTVQFFYAVTDSFNTSEAVAVTLLIENASPQALNDIYSVSYGQTLYQNAAQGLLANDTSFAGVLQISLLTSPVHGTVVLQQDGSFSYTGAAGFTGEETLTYRVTDQSGGYCDAVATFIVSAAVPAAQADIITLSAGNTFTAETLLANDFLQGVNTAALDGLYHIAVKDTAQNGTLSLNENGVFAYTSANDSVKADRFIYQVIDNDGNAVSESTAFIVVSPDGTDTLPMQPLSGSYNIDTNSAAFGQIAVGGTNTQISASAPFIPVNTDSRQSAQTASRQGTTIFTDENGEEKTEDEFEEVTVIVVSQNLGNNNWTYTETSIYSYLITSEDDIYWGGYTYIVSASFIDGSYNLSYFLTVSDNFLILDEINNVSDTSELHLATVLTGGITNTYTITQNYNTATTAAVISNGKSTLDSVVYTGIGTYQYATPGGSVRGTVFQSDTKINDSGFTVIKAGCNGNYVLTLGTQFNAITDIQTSSYQGSGNYHTVSEGDGFYSDMTGQIVESGLDFRSLLTTVTGLAGSDSQWTFLGTGSSGAEKEQTYISNGSGHYSNWEYSPGNLWNISGTHRTGVYEHEQSNETVMWLLTDEVWGVGSGTGTASGCCCDYYCYDGNGEYQRSGGSEGNHWESGGTLIQNGGNSECSSYNITSQFLNGSWFNTGNGSGCSNENSYSCYDGSGSYTSTFNDGNGSFSLSGTTNENGLDWSQMSNDTQSNLINGNWITTGTGDDCGFHCEHSDYNGTGTFTKKIDIPNIVNNAKYSGSANHNGNADSCSFWNADWTLQNDSWFRSDGSGTSYECSCSHIDFDGCATSEEKYIKDEISYSTKTNRHISGCEDHCSESTQFFGVANGNWFTASGTGWACGKTELRTDYSINQSKSTYSYNKAGDGSTESGSGCVSGCGCSTDTVCYYTDYELLDNNWTPLGTITYDFTSSDYIKRKGSGTFSKQSQSSDESGSSSETFNGTITLEEYESRTNFTDHYWEALHTDGSKTLESGTSDACFFDKGETNRTGNGTFSSVYFDEDGSKVETDGTSVIENYKKTFNFNKNEKQTVVNHQWHLNSGSSVSTITENSKITKEGTGTLTKQGTSYSITTEQSDIVDFIQTVTGNVRLSNPDNATSGKVWKYSGISYDKPSGTYTVTMPQQTADYSRSIIGGTVSGTVQKEKTKTNSYNINVTSNKSENETDWKITFGTKKYGNGITYSESYDGSGSYSYSNNGTTLSGDITECGCYSVTFNDAELTLTYNTGTKNWDESKTGTITYEDSAYFKDTGTGYYGTNGVINDRTAEYDYHFTATEYLGSGFTYYTLSDTVSVTFDAEETTAQYAGMNGDYLFTDYYHIVSTIAGNWTTDFDGLAFDYDVTRTEEFEDKQTESFIMTGGNSYYDTYSLYNSRSASGNTEEYLYSDAGFYNIEYSIYHGGYWEFSSLDAVSETVRSYEWSRSGSDSNACDYVDYNWFYGTSCFDENYSYYRKLTKNFGLAGNAPDDSCSDYGCGCDGCGYDSRITTTSGCGCEQIHYFRSDSFTGIPQTDDFEYCGYDCEYEDHDYSILTGNKYSHSSYDTDLSYTWCSGSNQWHITGSGDSESGFGYVWDYIYNYEYQNTTSSTVYGANHDETGIVHWTFDNFNGNWQAESAEGSGGGSYYCEYRYDTSCDYSSSFYSGTLTGHTESHKYQSREDNWNVSFSFVNGKVVRETDGGITITIDESCSYNENGESHGYSEESYCATAYGYYGYYLHEGTRTIHSEHDITYSANGEQNFFEQITAEWTNYADEQGNLIYNISADSDITSTSSADYSGYYHTLSFNEFDGCYHYSSSSDNGCYYSSSCTDSTLYTYSENENSFDNSEHFTATFNESRHSDGGAFYRVSFDGCANGNGTSEHNSHSCSDYEWEMSWDYVYNDYEYCCDWHDWGCECVYEYSDSVSDSCADYNYNASWNWSNDGERSYSLNNSVSGHYDNDYNHNYTHTTNCCGYEYTYTSSHSYIPRRTKVESKKRTAVLCQQPGLILFGTSTRAACLDALKPSMVECGLGSRCMFIEGGDRGFYNKKALDHTELPQELIDIAQWWKDFTPPNPKTGKISNLYDETPTPLVIKTTDEAETILDTLSFTADTNHQKETDSAIKTIWTRLRENTIKLALIYACSKNHEHPVIDKETACWASEFGYWVTLKMIDLVRKHIAGDAFEKNCKRVEDIIRKRGGIISRTELARTTHLRPRDLDEIIQALLTQEKIEVLCDTSSCKPKILYKLV